MQRCFWCNLKNQKYIEYHDNEWGRLRLDDEYLFEMLLLESFQAGLSWECVLNKRDAFKAAFDAFDYERIAVYDERKVQELLSDTKIIRNKLKIRAAVTNAKIFIDIKNEYGSFISYIKLFWNGNIIHDSESLTSLLSDSISKDLKKRGMKFLGSTVIQSFLQAVGIIYAHTNDCFLYKNITP